MLKVEHRPPLQQNTSDAEQPVGDTTQGAAVGMATRPQCGVAAAALGGDLDGYAGPMKDGLAHHNGAGFAAALGHGRHARQRPECRVLSAA